MTLRDTPYPTIYEHDLIVYILLNWYYRLYEIGAILCIFHSTASLTLAQSHDCPSIIEETLKGVGNINQTKPQYNTTKRESCASFLESVWIKSRQYQTTRKHY